MDWLAAVQQRWRAFWRERRDEPTREAGQWIVDDTAAREAIARAGRPATDVEWAAERLLEDERLRSNLTDDEFQPLLDWALEALEAVAADPRRAAALDEAVGLLRQILMSANDAMACWSRGMGTSSRPGLSPIVESLRPPLVAADRAEQAQREMARFLEHLWSRRPLDRQVVLGSLARGLRAATVERRGSAP